VGCAALVPSEMKCKGTVAVTRSRLHWVWIRAFGKRPPEKKEARCSRDQNRLVLVLLAF
jgi:hypothetical protein